MSYTAQELNTKIALQRFTPGSQDPLTGEILPGAWVTYAERFAKWEPLVGREFFAAKQGQSEAQAKATLRYMDGIVPTDRIRANGKNWNIVSAQNIKNRNRELLIYVTSGPAET